MLHRLRIVGKTLLIGGFGAVHAQSIRSRIYNASQNNNSHDYSKSFNDSDNRLKSLKHPVFEFQRDVPERFGCYKSTAFAFRARYNGKLSDNVYIITNYHAIMENDQKKYLSTDENDSLSLLLVRDGQYNKLKLLAADPQYDIAILKYIEPLDNDSMRENFKYFTPGIPHIGQTVWLIKSDNSLMSGSIKQFVKSCTFIRIFIKSPNNCIEASYTCVAGDSGGPVIDENGCVVAINFGHYVYRKLSLAIPIEYVNNLIHQYELTNAILLSQH